MVKPRCQGDDRSTVAGRQALPSGNQDLLRRSPPEATLAWVAAAVGPSSRVVSVRPLDSFSSAVHALLVLNRHETPHTVVLRRYLRGEWLRREPDLAEQEAHVLGILESTAVPAPRLISADPQGHLTDVPAVLMSQVDGIPQRSLPDTDRFILQLAEALVRVHSVSLPGNGMIRRYRPHNLHLSLPVPEWAAAAAIWERALEIYSGPVPDRDSAVLLHRDYHPGNVLWTADRVSGVVDWANASIGCAQADLGHCRMVLALSWGQERADRFLRAYRTLSGSFAHGYDPYWDLAAAVGAIPDLPLKDVQATRVDHFVGRAVRQLG